MLMKSLLKKSSMLICCTVAILFYYPLYAQVSSRVISISQSSIDITTLAKTISNQTGLEYSLNMQNSSLQKKVMLKPGKWKLEDIMKEVQQQAGLRYKIIGDHFLFTDYVPQKTAVPAAPAPAVKKARPVKATPPARVEKKVVAASPPVLNHPRNTTPKVYTHSPLRDDSILSNDVSPSLGLYHPNISIHPLLALPSIRSDEYLTRPIVDARRKQVVTPVASGPSHERIKRERESRDYGFFSPFAAIGFSASDILYANATLIAGLKYAYGIGSIGVGSHGARFRFGGGIRLPLDDRTMLHAMFTTGSMQRLSVDTVFIAPKNISVKEQLNTLDVAWSKDISPKVSFQAALNYNWLKKTSDSSFHTGEFNHFEYGHVLWHTSYSQGTHVEKIDWIGFRLSLFYYFLRH